MIIFKSIDILLFSVLALMVLYLLVFAIGSFFKRDRKYKEATRLNRFVVLFPAYGEDRVIQSTVSSFLNQDYPKDLFDVVVISDHMEDKTNEALSQLPIEVLIASYENSSKAKALNLAVDHLKGRSYDVLVILDADNVVDPDFLRAINEAYENGMVAIQAHRTAKNKETDVALLDAISEEINNSLFRMGTFNLGFSASLSGSGMAFNYECFCKHVKHLNTAGEDRELEALLLKDKVRVGYLPEVFVYDEKIQNVKGFQKQRKRWLAVQFGTLKDSIVDLGKAFSQGNYDYCNKLLQWMLLPRSILLLLLPFIAFVLTVIDFNIAAKWWGLTIAFYLMLVLLVPRSLVSKQLFRALFKIPVMGGAMLLNFFKLKEGRKTFIHTEHGEEEK